MGKPFNIAETFGEALKNVPNSDTGREQITYIDEGLISGDERNFYELSGLEDLAANIELIGLQQPIRVRPDPDDVGGYLIVSGHRRMAAIRQYLKPEAPEKWAQIPCIIEDRSDEPEPMQELRLIYANSDTRRITDAELAVQAQKVTELLYKLEALGYHFPGRMRDHVAVACKVSKSKLARLKVIQENLCDVYSLVWKAGEISEASAYLLAQQDKEIQRAVHRKCGSQVWHMTTDDLTKVIDSCKSDALSKTLDKLDRIVHKDQAAEKSMTEIGEDYVVQLQREDKRVDEVLRKCADHFIRDLVTGQTTRRDSIERLRVAMRNSASCGGGVDYDARNDGLTVDSLSRHPIKRSWPEVWDVLALIALQEWSVNRVSSAKNKREREALRDMREDIEHAPVVQWMPGQAKPPQNVTLLTRNLTNAGVVYRAAVWTGDRWVDPANRKKELTGLQVGSWMRIPESSQTFVEGSSTETIPAASGGWISAETPPDHPCDCVVEFDLGEDHLKEQHRDLILSHWDGETWLWRGDSHPVGMPAIRWCEVPCAAAPAVPKLPMGGLLSSPWIRVEDALPDPGKKVVTLDSDGDVDIDRIDADTGKFFFGEGRSYYVTHWTALPEKPEEDQ